MTTPDDRAAQPGAPEPLQPAPSPSDSPLRKRLMEWLEIVVKLTAPAAVVLVAILGHSLQGSLTTSQMLTQREHSDTTIRAEMFKSISERLFSDKSGKPLSAAEKAVFSELLALNFHEHIELKPLLLEVDQALIDAARGRPPAQRKVIESKREELQSIARRVRQRQTASLLQREGPTALASPVHAGVPSFAQPSHDTGRLQVISVRLKGYLPGVRGAMRSTCDVPKDEGPTVCVKEPVFDISPDGRSMLAITIDGADATRKRVRLSVKPSLLRPGAGAIPPAGEYPSDAPECGRKFPDSNPRASVATTGSSAVQFDATWFDFPLTDNTLLANGTRYSIFIEDLCFDEAGQQQTVKLGLLWFPKDYFPARERPTNFRDLRRKLGLELQG